MKIHTKNLNYAIGRVTVSRTLYEQAHKQFPVLKERPDYEAFFWYLSLGADFDKDTGKLLLCRNTIANLPGREPSNFEAGKFLEGFRNDVLGDKNFLWHHWYKKLCRKVARLNLGEFDADLNAELQGHFDGCDRVYLDGTKFTIAKARRLRAAERGIANSRPAFGAEALFIQQYLNSLPRNLFFKNFKRNYRKTLEFVTEKFEGTERQRELRILRHVECQPQPFYGATPKENTVRLFSYAHIAQLRREVRKVFTQGWIEADLRCAQLAICARLWEVHSVLEFLYQNGNIWEYLYAHLRLPREFQQAAKPALKQAVYSVCYGMKQVRIRSLLARNLVKNGVNREYAGGFLSIPFICDVLLAREEALQRVIGDGGARTCYGKTLQIAGDVQARDILAQLAQSWEMKLIYPAFALTANHPCCKIMLYQFDGFSAQFTRRPTGWACRIKEAVDARAKEFGVPTWLEWDEKQLAELEWAQLYEELKSVSEEVPCTLEDEGTYKYLESYYKKIN
jgi:hypothetical protein